MVVTMDELADFVRKRELCRKRLNIDLGLSVLVAIKSPTDTLTANEISDVCGCDRSMITYIEKKALAKLANNRVLRGYR